MYFSPLLNSTSVVKENHIDNYLGCCEIAGDDSIRVSDDLQSSQWHYILLCNRGELHIESPKRSVTVKRGLANLSLNTSLDRLEYRKNFHGYLIAIDKKLMIDILRNRNPFPPTTREYISMPQHSGDLDNPTIRTLSKDCRNMLGSLGNKEHSLLEELSYAYLYIFLTDIADIVWRKVNSMNRNYQSHLSRPQDIMLQFMQLLHENIEKEASVSFYAGKLCLSKQYLSEIVLNQTKSTIGNFISSFRFEWCITYMDNPAYSLKQVADKMSFPDQSSFGKFFKRHSGKTPAVYRSERKNTLLSRRDI